MSDGERERKLDALVASLSSATTKERRKTARRELETFASAKVEKERDEAVARAEKAERKLELCIAALVAALKAARSEP